MGNRNLWIGAAVVAVLAIVIVIGLQQRDTGVAVASPSASATPRGTATAAANATTAVSFAPTASPGSSAVYNDDFGFVVTDVGAGSTIRSESGAPRQGLSFSSQGFAISPDGKNIAYWTLGTSAGPQQLRTFTTLGNATEQTWVTLTAGQRGGGIAWSSDGAGVLYSTETGSFGIGGGTNSATLDVYEFAVGGRRGTIDTQTNTGWLYRPIAWDRSVNLAAAGLTGEGAGMAFYVTVRINPDNSFNAQRVDTRSNGMQMNTIRASSDAKLVLGVDFGSGEIRFWPLADFSARKTSGNGKTGALWQPGTHKIGFLSADSFFLFQADDGSTSTTFRGVKPGSLPRVFRADGTAVVLAVPQGTGLGATEYTVVRLSDGATSSFTATGGLAASVRVR